MTPVEKGLDKVETDIDIRVSQIPFEWQVLQKL